MIRLKPWNLQQIINGLVRSNKIKEVDRLLESNKYGRILEEHLNKKIIFSSAWTHTGRKQDDNRKCK